MPSKTPLFDTALDKILNDLVPHTRTCIETGEEFAITERDIAMLKLLRVPPPKKTWWASTRQKRAFIGNLTLFRRDIAGGKSVVSMYDPESFANIVPQVEWYGDSWDPMSFGSSPDFSKPFFTQWGDFSRRIPRPAIIQDTKSINSEWSVYSFGYKDCYLCGPGSNNENVQYADVSMNSKNCSDVILSIGCEFCYEIVSCTSCTRTVFSEQCENCMDVAFSLGCKNCSDCFGCTNLRDKKFCFLNEQLTEEEYRKRRGAIDLGDARVVQEWVHKMEQETWKTAFRKAGRITRSENALGDVIVDSNNVEGISIHNAERVYYGFGCLFSGKDSMDFTSVGDIELCYNVCRTIKAYGNHMTLGCENSINVEYSELLTACENCFGCFGLKHKKFCIFNKQYTEEEYWSLVDKIKTAMLERGEYGDFFPYASLPYAYNTSHADAMFPLEKGTALALGARWYDFPKDSVSSEVLPLSELSENLSEIDESILSKSFLCPETGRAFRFIQPELELHRALGVALPRVHYSARFRRRSLQLLPMRLYARKCDVCAKKIESRYPPAFPSKVYCQECYEKAVL